MPHSRRHTADSGQEKRNTEKPQILVKKVIPGQQFTQLKIGQKCFSVFCLPKTAHISNARELLSHILLDFQSSPW